MPFATMATPLTLLALALPFLFCFTQAPINNFWPLLVSWGCGAVLVLLALARCGSTPGRGQQGETGGASALVSSRMLAAGLLVAALISAGIGLLQYFVGDPGLPGVQPSTLGQAVGNLRQRNQQATLLSLGVWALLWGLAQMQARLQHPGIAAPVQGGKAWPGWLTGLLVAWALALLAMSSAATASRTGAVQWLLILGLMFCWSMSLGRLVLGLGLVGLILYGAAAWLLPRLLLDWTGFASDGLFVRILDEEPGCTSRRVLWANVLHLIAQKPWAGWGWGELDYAHYVTVFPGERFCVLLDNAHNLPLHLAVELGVPVALIFCAAVVVWVLREKPWRETDPARQLAWGVLALVGLHSLLEALAAARLGNFAGRTPGCGRDHRGRAGTRGLCGLGFLPCQPAVPAAGRPATLPAPGHRSQGGQHPFLHRSGRFCAADHHRAFTQQCGPSLWRGQQAAALLARAPGDRAADRKRHDVGAGRRGGVSPQAIPCCVPGGL